MGTQLQALELWRHSLVASVRDDAPDLSARQMALLLTVFMGEGPHTVRGLAKTLKISKPAVSRALDRLGELGYIRRERDELDRRNVLVRRMSAGGSFLKAFADQIVSAQTVVATLPMAELDFGLDVAVSTTQTAQVATGADAPAWVDVAA